MNTINYVCLLQLAALMLCGQVHAADTAASPAAAPTMQMQSPGLRVKVTAIRQTVLSSQMPGHISQLAVRDGDEFTKGQILVRMDCSVPMAQQRRAEAAVHKATSLYNTTKKLAELNSRSQLELAVARAELEQAAAEASMARTAVERCDVRAPFTGRVADRLAQENQFVNEGQPLLEVLDPSELEMECIVPSAWLPWFTPGYAFNVRIDETQSVFHAKLARLSGKVDAVSQSIKAYAVFAAHDSKLLPGMSGEAFIRPPDGQAQ